MADAKDRSNSLGPITEKLMDAQLDAEEELLKVRARFPYGRRLTLKQEDMILTAQYQFVRASILLDARLYETGHWRGTKQN
jgi:hypothetical protein